METSREIAIANAKLVLKQAGYFVDNLWHVNDVQDRFECDDFTAQDILNDALTNDYIIEKIFESIFDYSKNENLNEKEI
jgi:hypothetical protein